MTSFSHRRTPLVELGLSIWYGELPGQSLAELSNDMRPSPRRLPPVGCRGSQRRAMCERASPHKASDPTTEKAATSRPLPIPLPLGSSSCVDEGAAMGGKVPWVWLMHLSDGNDKKGYRASVRMR
jgi:hypothetical protein